MGYVSFRTYLFNDDGRTCLVSEDLEDVKIVLAQKFPDIRFESLGDALLFSRESQLEWREQVTPYIHAHGGYYNRAFYLAEGMLVPDADYEEMSLK
jgi:hypothetical protein